MRTGSSIGPIGPNATMYYPRVLKFSTIILDSEKLSQICLVLLMGDGGRGGGFEPLVFGSGVRCSTNIRATDRDKEEVSDEPINWWSIRNQSETDNRVLDTQSRQRDRRLIGDVDCFVIFRSFVLIDGCSFDFAVSDVFSYFFLSFLLRSRNCNYFMS